jgi:uncharacterized protein YjbI with pentapeptide repeats
MYILARHVQLVCGLCLAISLAAIGAARAADPDQVQQLKTTHKCPLCHLEEAKLSGLQLQGSDLSGANLSNAELYGTNLKGANLSGTIFQGANLKMADLSGATDASLSDAQTDERTICPSGDHGPCQ